MTSKSTSAAVPRDLTLQHLEDITDGFSKEHRVGSGGYGDVYKGVLDDGEVIAVKKLHPTLTPDRDEEFNKEFNNLMKVQHQNIVRLVGYCYETKRQCIEDNGEYHLAKLEDRVLCFEYLQKGSLDRHLSDESCGLDWCTRYKIIKGICEGLNYLHGGLNKPIFHLDIKPSNILLDDEMVPKIADFGLSRFFMETKSHLSTKIIKGTIKYMPPEYIAKQQISDKHDVYSLGIVILEIIIGPDGHQKFVDMPREELVELVHSNWRSRIQATTPMYATECCQQVKRCLEIALECLEYDRNKRPTIRSIIDELTKIEILNHDVSVPFFETRGVEGREKTMLARSGPWGGSGRTHNIKVAPHRLESVTVWSADIVDAFAFSYTDLNGKRHTIGTWGGPGGFTKRIQFGPSEFLVEVSGTTGPYVCAVTDVIKSLTLVTNVRSYGPFGSGGGTPFRTSVRDSGSIVGFFGRSGGFLHAIGVYVNPHRLTPAELETVEEGGGGEDPVVTKTGLWGGNGGIPYDMDVVPHRLESITICSDVVVRSLAFSYTDVKGEQHAVSRWGGPGGSPDTIRLGRFNYIKGISGTIAPFDKSPNVITSLTISTNIDNKIYGPFGQGGGTPFTIPVAPNGAGVVGFFGRARLCLDALGVYIRPY